jgi:hypothetical protein
MIPKESPGNKFRDSKYREAFGALEQSIPRPIRFMHGGISLDVRAD